MSSKRLAIVAVALVGALALAACGGSAGTAEQETPEPEVVEVRVENGEPVGGTQTVEVDQGDEVHIRVDVDAPQELHLHGYEIETEAEPGKAAVLSFTADLEGVFELESHLADATLVRLVVNP